MPFLTVVEVVNPFRAKDAKKRLMKDPKTAAFMRDRDFVKGLDELGGDHQALQK